jgi:hypothetical protein
VSVLFMLSLLNHSQLPFVSHDRSQDIMHCRGTPSFSMVKARICNVEARSAEMKQHLWSVIIRAFLGLINEIKPIEAETYMVRNDRNNKQIRNLRDKRYINKLQLPKPFQERVFIPRHTCSRTSRLDNWHNMFGFTWSTTFGPFLFLRRETLEMMGCGMNETVSRGSWIVDRGSFRHERDCNGHKNYDNSKSNAADFGHHEVC